MMSLPEDVSMLPTKIRLRNSKRLLVEAAIAVVAARLMTLLPFRTALRLAGLRSRPLAPPPIADRPASAELVLLSAAIRRIAGLLPFRTACLQQGLAAALMLRRRGLAAELHLAAGRVDRRFSAHAVCVHDGCIVTGDGVAEGYRPLARFVADPSHRPGSQDRGACPS
jgi:hypothetical protein